MRRGRDRHLRVQDVGGRDCADLVRGGAEFAEEAGGEGPRLRLAFHVVAAAGLGRPAGAQRAVTWTSADGLSWPAATQAGGGVRQITALSASGGTVTGTAQQGAASYVVALAAPAPG
jgi:hypothetical protein